MFLDEMTIVNPHSESASSRLRLNASTNSGSILACEIPQRASIPSLLCQVRTQCLKGLLADSKSEAKFRRSRSSLVVLRRDSGGSSRPSMDNTFLLECTILISVWGHMSYSSRQELMFFNRETLGSVFPSSNALRIHSNRIKWHQIALRMRRMTCLKKLGRNTTLKLRKTVPKHSCARIIDI